MTLLTRGRDENRTEPILHGETTRELLITHQVLTQLIRGHAFDRPIE
jgi:hypothetical protein